MSEVWIVRCWAGYTCSCVMVEVSSFVVRSEGGEECLAFNLNSESLH